MWVTGETMTAIVWTFIHAVLCVSLITSPILGETFEYQSLFTRVPQHYINAFPLKVFDNTTVEDCAKWCVQEIEFECKSFDIDNRLRECHLHNHSHTDPLIGLQESLSVDHYRTGYEKLFNRIPNHIITIKHKRNIRGLTVEDCARRCLQEITFNCRGFDYETRRRNCWLTDKGLEDTDGLKKRPNTDFYERKSNGHLSRFINYGYGSLQPVEGIQIHNKLVLGVNLEACAQLCLAETTFKCMSFDYVFGEQSCQMSHLIAANVHGIRTDFESSQQVMHFEVIGRCIIVTNIGVYVKNQCLLAEENLVYFYPTPFASVLGHNDKIYKKVTPDTCARKCLEERQFICRSFDYRVTEGTCFLSHVTGSDAGGLYTPNGVHVHHFELKPSLDCGDELTGDRGSIASPNWPRHYSHHLNCTWTIAVPKFKIVRFEIYHLDLGSQTENPCDRVNDVLVFSEVIEQKRKNHCVRNHLTEYSSLTNNVAVIFHTNVDNDAQGFRIFYSADWPCSANITENNGEFASPRWPQRYPPMTSCTYRITAPFMTRIYLLFNSVRLEDHIGSRCPTAYDKINVYDGNSTEGTLLDTLCGSMASTSFTSTSNSLYIEFISDSRIQSEGFHASYRFIYPPTSTTTTSTTTTETTSEPNGAIAINSDLTRETNETIQTSNKGSGQDDAYEYNNSVSINLALHDRVVNKKQLDADFIESSDLADTGNESGWTNIAADPGITGDDIGRGQPSDKSSVFEEHEKMMRAIIWGTAASFVFIFIVVLATTLVMCRQHRKKASKHREGSNIRYPEENMSLFEKTGSVCAPDFEEDVDDDARLPLPSSPDPPPDVEFLNPLYVQRHTFDENGESELHDVDTRTIDSGNLATTCSTITTSTTDDRDISTTTSLITNVTCDEELTLLHIRGTHNLGTEIDIEAVI